MASTLTYLVGTYWPFLAASLLLGIIVGFAARPREEDEAGHG